MKFICRPLCDSGNKVNHPKIKRVKDENNNNVLEESSGLLEQVMSSRRTFKFPQRAAKTIQARRRLNFEIKPTSAAFSLLVKRGSCLANISKSSLFHYFEASSSRILVAELTDVSATNSCFHLFIGKFYPNLICF